MIARRVLPFALVLATLAAAASAAPGSVSGKAVVLGKTLDLRHAILVRVPDGFDETKLSSVILLSAKDVSADVRKCATRKCVIYEALQNGMLIEPKEMGFWVLVVHPDVPQDTQFSGPSMGDTGWKTTAQSATRLAGTLHYEDKDRKTSCDLAVDAPLVKEIAAAVEIAPGPKAKALPAGGGAPGAAWLLSCKEREAPTSVEAFEKDLARQGKLPTDDDLKQMSREKKKTVTRREAVQQAYDFLVIAAKLAPSECRVVGGRADDAVALLDVEAKVAGGRSKAQVVMVRKDGKWQVGKEKTWEDIR